MSSEEESYETIRPGLYSDVQTLNEYAPNNRKISGKTLRKIFVNWMTLAGMDQYVADAIEARDDHNVSNISYHATADTKGKLQYPKYVKLFLLEYPIPDWMINYEGNAVHKPQKKYTEKEEKAIVRKMKKGWTNKDLKMKGVCGSTKASELAKKYHLDRNGNRGRRKESEL